MLSESIGLNENEISLKSETLFPSANKQGVFYYEPVSSSLWEGYTGIDYNAENKFRYALGTWTEVTRNNRGIKIYSNDTMDFIRLGADEEPGEPLPTYTPDGFLENTEENAEELEPKPPEDSRKMYSGYRIHNDSDATFNELVDLAYEDGWKEEDLFTPMFQPSQRNNIVKQLAVANEPGYQHLHTRESIPSGYADADETWEWLHAPKYMVSMPGAYIAESENYNLSYDNRPDARWGGFDGINSDRINYFDVGIPDGSPVNGPDFRSGGYVKAGGNWKVGRVNDVGGSYHAQGLGTWYHKKLEIDMIPFHNDDGPITSANPEFQLHNVRRGPRAENHASWKEAYTDADLQKMGQGFWKIKKDEIEMHNPYLNKKKKRKLWKRAKDVVGNIFRSGGTRSWDAVYFTYVWEPALDLNPYYNRAGAYSNDYEWRWTGTEWKPSETLLVSPLVRKPKNEFVGVPIISHEHPDMLNAAAKSPKLDTKDLPLYHDNSILEVVAPLKIWFGVDFYKQDLEPTFNAHIYKYHIIQWGDEDNLMSDEDIMLSEFFSLYDVEEDDFDRGQAKIFIQIVKTCKYLKQLKDDDTTNQKLNFTPHTYLTGGVKTIKTVVFRLDATESTLYETTLITTNINVGDAGEDIKDFNIFGASNFNVLPLNLDKKELMIGAIDKNSDYVNALRNIDKSDFYGPKDYLEKKHIEEFLPKADNSEYGNHPGKLDLSTTRVFNKPYDISYFIDPISTTENRSKATDILIDNNDCIIEINPSKTIGLAIENTGKSDIRGVLIGDYSLEKEEYEDELKKESNMKVSKIQKKNKDQAI